MFLFFLNQRLCVESGTRYFQAPFWVYATVTPGQNVHSGLYWGSLDSIGVVWVPLGYSGLYWGSLHSIWVVWVPLRYTGLYWGCLDSFIRGVTVWIGSNESRWRDLNLWMNWLQLEFTWNSIKSDLNPCILYDPPLQALSCAWAGSWSGKTWSSTRTWPTSWNSRASTRANSCSSRRDSRSRRPKSGSCVCITASWRGSVSYIYIYCIYNAAVQLCRGVWWPSSPYINIAIYARYKRLIACVCFYPKRLTKSTFVEGDRNISTVVPKDRNRVVFEHSYLRDE